LKLNRYLRFWPEKFEFENNEERNFIFESFQ
jgi:hypothetical protein